MTPPPLPRKRQNSQPAWVKLVIVLGVLGIVVPITLVATNLSRVYTVPNKAMAPAIEPGDRILMEGLSYLHRPPHRGDILIFKTEGIEGLGHQTYVKRLVGLPGEELRIDHDSLYVNGERVSIRNKEGEIAYQSLSSRYLRNSQETFKIPPDSYFVLGDNTMHSADSRMWGSVPARSVLGRAAWCYWPPAHVGHIE